jgi:intracellular multiplication protein IcmC
MQKSVSQRFWIWAFVFLPLLLLTLTGYADNSGADQVRAVPDIIMDNLNVIARIFQTVSVLLGLSLFIGGLLKLKKYGEMRTMMAQQMPISVPLFTILAGVIFLILPVFMSTMLDSFWGLGATTDAALPMDFNNADWDAYIPPILLLVRLIGVYAFMRGIMTLANSGGQQSGQQGGGLGKVLLYMLSGILCVHIDGTMYLIENFFGLSWG